VEKQWEEQERITAVPSKYDLTFGFMSRQPVAFTLAQSGKIAVVINRLEHEDGSSNSFNFVGIVSGQGGLEVKGYFHLNGRGHAYLEHRSRVRVVSAS
jgi:hypothetical protein